MSRQYLLIYNHFVSCPFICGHTFILTFSFILISIAPSLMIWEPLQRYHLEILIIGSNFRDCRHSIKYCCTFSISLPVCICFGFFYWIYRDLDPLILILFSDVVFTNWKDSPRTVLNIYHELIQMGLRIWVFRLLLFSNIYIWLRTCLLICLVSYIQVNWGRKNLKAIVGMCYAA